MKLQITKLESSTFFASFFGLYVMKFLDYF